MTATPENVDLGHHVLQRRDTESRGSAPARGVTEEIVREMSRSKGEPAWMLEMRLESLAHVDRRPMPRLRDAMPEIRLDDMLFDSGHAEGRLDEGGDIPNAVDGANRHDGTPEGEHRYPGGATARQESEAVVHRRRSDLEGLGVVFCDMHTALRDHEELVKSHFGTIIAGNDDMFASLNTGLWTGGSFIYVPPGVDVDVPLHTSFGVNAENTRRFERTLIIADEGSKVHYIEGCSAPVYTSDPLHSTAVEVVVKPSARVRCTTIQNWSSNVFKIVMKRAHVEAEGHVEWTDCTIGSRLTMTHPGAWLVGPGATAEVLSMAYAGASQHQDTGAGIVHAAPETSSKITSKTVSKDGGRATFRAAVRVDDDAYGCTSQVDCDALVLDDESSSDSHPLLEIGSPDARIGHEATVSTVAAAQLFYLMSRGLSEEQATSTVVNGFVEPVIRALPMEYAVEWSRLIELQMAGSVG